MNSGQGNTTALVWTGVAIGAAIGIGIALSRRKRDPWHQARHIGKRVADRSGDFAEAGRDILDHVKTIYDESRKVVEEAAELWSHGRKLVGY